MEEATWVTLHPPLLEMILERLPVPDYLRFPAVCSSWRDVQWDHRLHYASSPRHERQKPWIMFQNFSLCQFMLYNPSEQRYYRFPYYWALHFCGCSHGWLIFFDRDDDELYFVNPFTELEITIPHINKWFESSWYRHSLSIVILSSVPTDPGCIFVVGWSNGEVHCLINGESQKQIRIKEKLNYCPTSAISGDKFYILDELRGSSKFNLILIELFPVLSQRVIEMDYSSLKPPYEGIKYLMESDGDLLMAIRDNEDGVPLIRVFKADLSRNAWVMLESLNDRVLFLRSDQSFSLSAVDTGGSENRIYCECVTRKDKELMGIEYDYKTHLVIKSKHPSMKSDRNWSCDPSWMVPNLIGITSDFDSKIEVCNGFVLSEDV